MKKFSIALIAFFAIFASAFAQQLKTQSVQNTLWTGFGVPNGRPDGEKHGDFTWAGLIDTVQARVDVGKFTMDGMLSWGMITTDEGAKWTNSPFSTFEVINTKLTQFQFLNENRSRASYYLNFVWHPFEGFDAGMGTDLGWQVGPYPYTDGLTWMPLSHVSQGDLPVSGRSGGVDTDNGKKVVGGIRYAYKYAEKALGVRYKYKDVFQIGVAIPDFNDTRGKFDEDFTLNIGAEVHPIDLLTIAAAYENLIHKNGNFYTGLKLDFTDNFKIDAWFGINGIALKKDSDDDGWKKWGTGVAVYVKFGSLPLWIRPEAGFTDLLYKEYTGSFYTGGRIQWDITDKLHLGGWASFAWGAKDKRWEDMGGPYDDWNGGHIFNIRPDFSFDINENHSISAVFEYEKTRYPDDSVTNGMIFGFFWKYNRAF